MAARSKKRLCKNENKLLKLDNLQLKDVICSICQSILIEPVTLPCFHDFCKNCFNGSVENNALCCPLCRLRIGSWLRSNTKQKKIVNEKLWDFLQLKFADEITAKVNGEDLHLPDETPKLRLSKPGEIRSEYEAELKRLRAERQQLEEKHLKETEQTIRKIQEEEEEAHKRYLERLKEDEVLARSISIQEISKSKASIPKKDGSQNIQNNSAKPKFKSARIDSFLSKKQMQIFDNSPLITDDNTSTDSSTPKTNTTSTLSRGSPEMIPSYSKYIKNILESKLKNMKKGECSSTIVKPASPQPETSSSSKTKKKIQSLPVSIPYTGILQHKKYLNRNFDTGSADSMQQELCYFKPIEGTTPTSVKPIKGLPLRVPCIRADRENVPQPPPLASDVGPTRAQYIDALCKLRNASLSQNLRSAFVVALSLLRNEEKVPEKPRLKRKAGTEKSVKSNVITNTPSKKSKCRNNNIVEGITALNAGKSLRRTRSMGSINVEENSQKNTKLKERKVVSERKPYLRSDSKRNSESSRVTPPLVSDNNNKVNPAVKNLSSPFEHCDVKKILEEQLRIERLIEQEQKDLELARQIDEKLNGRQPRRASLKRQVTLNYALRPPKKLRVQ